MPKSLLDRFAITALGLECFLGISAMGGGAALVASPSGELLGLPIELLKGSVFPDYLIPGVALFVVLGLGSLGAAWLSKTRHPLAPAATATAGTALLIWMTVEILNVGYTNTPPLQPIYLTLGFALLATGIGWWRLSRSSR